MTYEYMMGMGAVAAGCSEEYPIAVLNDPSSKPDEVTRLRLENCANMGHSHQNFDQWCCPRFGGASGIRACPPGGLEHYLMNPGESMDEPCFDEGTVQRDPRGAWGRVWCCPPELRAIPSQLARTEGEQAYNRCVAEGGVQAFEDPLTGKPAEVADWNCSYSGRLVTKEHRRPQTAAEEATALREMCCQERSFASTISQLVSPAPVTSSEIQPMGPLTTTHQVGAGTLRISWGGVALLGLTGVFFYWFWKKFMPAMKKAGEQKRVSS